MKLYIGDYLGDTQHLSTLEHGAYILLIMAYWQHGGPIENDPKLLRRLTRTDPKTFQKVSENVLKMFQVTDGLLVHKRIEKELRKRIQVSTAARDAINTRWYGRITDVLPTNNERNTTPIVHSPYSKDKENIKSKKDKSPSAPRPTIEEVSAYCLERENGVNPAKWYAHYESNGWKVGKNPMKDWKAAVRTWEDDKPKKQEPKREADILDFPWADKNPTPPDIKAAVDAHYRELEERERARV